MFSLTEVLKSLNDYFVEVFTAENQKAQVVASMLAQMTELNNLAIEFCVKSEGGEFVDVDLYKRFCEAIGRESVFGTPPTPKSGNEYLN